MSDLKISSYESLEFLSRLNTKEGFEAYNRKVIYVKQIGYMNSGDVIAV